MNRLKSFGSSNADEVNSFPICVQGADGSVFAIALLDIFLYPKVTTYFGLMLRVPVMGVRTLYLLVIMGETLLNQLITLTLLSSGNHILRIRHVKYDRGVFYLRSKSTFDCKQCDYLSINQLFGNCRGKRTVSPRVRICWEELWLQPWRGHG